MPRVSLFASLRKAAGAKEVPGTGGTIAEVLANLVERYPLLAAQLVEDGRIRPHVVITINGHTITDEHAPVAADDQIAVFPPIAGG